MLKEKSNLNLKRKRDHFKFVQKRHSKTVSLVRKRATRTRPMPSDVRRVPYMPQEKTLFGCLQVLTRRFCWSGRNIHRNWIFRSYQVLRNSSMGDYNSGLRSTGKIQKSTQAPTQLSYHRQHSRCSSINLDFPKFLVNFTGLTQSSSRQEALHDSNSCTVTGKRSRTCTC